MREVHSSHVAKIGYDAQTGDLFVTWDTGKTSAYAGVPAVLADDVMNAWSVGSALASSIKGQYEHRYV
jgi:hypothetical protein